LDKQYREDLKNDQFVEAVGHSVEYVASHKSQVYTYVGLGLAAVAIALGVYWFAGSRKAQQQADLAQALQIRNAIIGAKTDLNDLRPAFATEDDKSKALVKALTEVSAKHSGTDAASVAHYQLAAVSSDKGDLAEAAKHFEKAVSEGSRDYSSVAKLSLAQVYHAQGKAAEAEKLLKELMASPSTLVSKEQATFTLARLLMASNPGEARKLIDPLTKDSSPIVVRNAVGLIGELPAAK